MWRLLKRCPDPLRLGYYHAGFSEGQEINNRRREMQVDCINSKEEVVEMKNRNEQTVGNVAVYKGIKWNVKGMVTRRVVRAVSNEKQGRVMLMFYGV